MVLDHLHCILVGLIFEVVHDRDLGLALEETIDPSHRWEAVRDGELGIADIGLIHLRYITEG